MSIDSLILAAKEMWGIVAGAVLLGSLLTILLRSPLASVFEYFTSRARSIRRYWKFVFLFSFFVLTSALTIVLFAPIEVREMYINIWGQVSTLVFAIFVGYLAFLELVEGQRVGLKARAVQSLRAKDYARAARYTEEMCANNTADFFDHATLNEIYLLTERFSDFEKRVSSLERHIVDVKDNLVYGYLRAASHLLRQRISDANQEIASIVDFKKRDRTPISGWSFADMENSPVYSSLPASSDAKKTLENVVKYISNQMTAEETEKFEQGNYTLA